MSEVESQAPEIPGRLSGVAKASVLLISLGAGVSSGVMQHLTPDEVERLTAEIVKRRKVMPDLVQRVIEEGRKALTDRAPTGGEDYARELLGQVFGENKAKDFLNRLQSGGSGGGPTRALRGVPPRHLAQALKSERPQVVALVLGHLPAEHAAQVLSVLPEQLQGEVALRLTTMLPTDPEIVNNVARVLVQQLSSSDNAAFMEVGGNDSIIDILNNVGRSTEKKILEYLTEVDERVANQIKERMFTFDDILSLDDRSMQVILRDVPQDDLRLAMKGAPENVKEVFFRNMSQRAAETLKEDLEASGPVKLRDVEAAQSRIVSIARQLDEAGEISLRNSGEDLVV